MPDMTYADQEGGSMSDGDEAFEEWLNQPVTTAQIVDDIIVRVRVLGGRIKRGSHTERVINKVLIDAISKLNQQGDATNDT